MKRKYLSPLESEIEELSNLIDRLQISFTDSEHDVYTKIATVCLNLGDMRISLDKIKNLVKESYND